MVKIVILGVILLSNGIFGACGGGSCSVIQKPIQAPVQKIFAAPVQVFHGIKTRSRTRIVERGRVLRVRGCGG